MARRNQVNSRLVACSPASATAHLETAEGRETEIRRVGAPAPRDGVVVLERRSTACRTILALAAQMEELEGEPCPLALVQDTGARRQRGLEAYLAYYGVLASMAARVPELASELAPTVAFMANGPSRVGRSGAGPAPAPTLAFRCHDEPGPARTAGRPPRYPRERVRQRR